MIKRFIEFAINKPILNHILLLFLFVLSIVFLIPGITQPLLTIQATIEKQEMIEIAKQSLLTSDQANGFVQNILRAVVDKIHVQGSVQVFESTRSLWGTLVQLINHHHIVVGLLISLFGVIIPLFKICITVFALLAKSEKIKGNLLKISSMLSKWSMSDVFVMALLLVFLTVNANEQAINAVEMHAKLEIGFYCFSAYCVLAIAAAQLLQNKHPKLSG
jgi:hypothetical protein